MNIMKSLLTLACLLCCTGISAYDFEVDGIYYNILTGNDKACEVTSSGEIIRNGVWYKRNKMFVF